MFSPGAKFNHSQEQPRNSYEFRLNLRKSSRRGKKKDKEELLLNTITFHFNPFGTKPFFLERLKHQKHFKRFQNKLTLQFAVKKKGKKSYLSEKPIFLLRGQSKSILPHTSNSKDGLLLAWKLRLVLFCCCCCFLWYPHSILWSFEFSHNFISRGLFQGLLQPLKMFPCSQFLSQRSP